MSRPLDREHVWLRLIALMLDAGLPGWDLRVSCEVPPASPGIVLGAQADADAADRIRAAAGATS